MSELHGNGPCAACGKNPAEGYASIYLDGVERWYCHPDEGPSCYERAEVWPLDGERHAGTMIWKNRFPDAYEWGEKNR